MEVFSIKKIQAYEYATFTEFKAVSDLNYCCKRFKNYTSNFNSWDEKSGKFCIVHEDSFIPIEYCPFCGEEIHYAVYD